jgi:gas vesicle protein
MLNTIQIYYPPFGIQYNCFIYINGKYFLHIYKNHKKTRKYAFSTSWQDNLITFPIHLNKKVMKSNTKVILGMIAAAAAGAAIGILATSEDGKKFRKKVKTTATDAAGNVSDWIKDKAEDLQDLKDKAIKKTKGWKNDLKDVAEM